MSYACALGATLYRFADLKALLGRASPPRAGDRLAGLAAESAEECVAARLALADLPLVKFLDEPLIPYEADEVTRLIADSHDRAAFAPAAALTVGGFRDFLLSDAATTEMLAALAPGVTPEMAAAVSKLMRNQDLIAVAEEISVVTRFRTTIGLPGRLSVRLQPNHPSDDLAGHRRRHPRRADVWMRRCLHRDQSGDRQWREALLLLELDRGAAAALRNPNSILRALPCHDHAAGDAERRHQSISCFNQSPARRPPTAPSA